jgi:hypothetical protein
MDSIEAFSRMTPPPPMTWSSYGWTYRARTPTSEFVVIDSFVGVGDASTSWRAQGRKPVASSNAEFSLPMMKMRRPA